LTGKKNCVTILINSLNKGDKKLKQEDYEFKKQYKNAVVKEIKTLRKKGATYQEIADKLNKENVETISGSGAWYPQSVHKLC